MVLELLRLKTTYRNIGRIRQILNVFIKHGFGQFVALLNLYKFVPFRKRIKLITQTDKAQGLLASERLRQAFTELGPSFIKLGQILSTRPDLIGDKYASEFERLQDEVTPFPYVTVKEILERELKRPLKDIFASIDEVPVAAASIAQVHNAVLADGAKVVIKVQRPHIKDIIETDVSIMRIMSDLMVKYIPETEIFNPQGIVQEFSRLIKRELNFIEEEKNISRFRRNFDKVPSVVIPVTYPEFCTESVVVMERIEGIRISDIEAIDRAGIDRKALAKTIVNAYFKMILEDGFFHADPHSGNLFALPDGRLGIVDFGMANWLLPDTMEGIAAVLMCLVKRDFEGLVDNFMALGIVPEELDLERVRQEFLTDMLDFLIPLYDTTMSELKFSEYLDNVVHLAFKHNLKIPSSIIMIDKCMIIVQNTVGELDPKFNFISEAAPYASRLAGRRYGPRRMLEKFEKHLSDITDTLVTTPKRFSTLLRRMVNNDFGVKISFTGLDRLTRDIDRSTNRLSFSIIVGSIIMSSSILTLSGAGAKVMGIPVLGTIGFVVAFVLGVWLLISILRSGRL
jgi:ubiquinone biosynthesis protein